MVRGFWKKGMRQKKYTTGWLTFLKTNSLHLESDGWKTILSFSGRAYFRGFGC